MIDREHALKPIALALGLAWGGAAAQGTTAPTVPPATPATQVIEVIGTAPLPGQGVDRDLLPYNTQLLRRSDIDRYQTEHTTDLLARRAAGVQVNEVQGSPYQGDLTFRGFRASGLLGAAQGLSVYLDGVRINEPFGDVVNWDLLPEFALDSVALVPGANPAFGLNTLGGAIAMTTVDGRSAPGLRAEARLGSFARRQVSLSHGGSQGGWSHYVGVGGFAEDGWRDHSDGHLGTLLAKLDHRSDAGTFRLSFLSARSRLVGNGLVPFYTFDEPDDRSPDLGSDDRAAVYTHPDLTRQHVNQLSLRWTRSLDNGQVLEALAYVRHSRRTTINGDEADDAEPGDDANASFNRTATRQRGQGVALGWSGRHGDHQWLAGLSYDQATVRYEQTEQEGEFDDTRGVDPIDGEEPELSAAVRGSSRSFGAHASDTWRLAAGTHLTGTLRFNAARVGNTLTSVDDDTGEVEERPHEAFSYRSWNPALGVAHRLAGTGTTVFANLSRNTRVPTVIELGCADPEEPCRLPAGLQADPYLAPVRTTSLEAGLRYGRPQGHSGSLTVYRADNRDDILFSSVSVTGQLGYFRNFERTRHQGLDAEWRWRGGGWDLGLAYSHLQAIYQAEGVLRIGERNVQVRPGTRIAGLPRHTLKASLERSLGAALTVGADLQAVSRRVSAGNEDGRYDDDEAETADFSVPGYAIINLHTSWRPTPGVEVYARVHNLFDRRSASFGALAETLFDRGGAYTGEEADALFVAPGAPRSFGLGVRVRF